MTAAVLVVVTAMLLRLAVRASDGAAVRARLPGRPVGPPAAVAPGWFAGAVDAMGLPWPASQVWRGWCGAGVAVPATLLAAGPGPAGLALLLVVGGPAVAWVALRHRGAARIEAALPGVLEAVARSLRSGASLAQALAEAALEGGPVACELAQVVASSSRGAGLAAALREWPVRHPSPGVRLAAGALALAAETGGATARAVDGVATTLRQRAAVAAEVSALAASARASAAVLAVAPLAFGAFAAVVDRRSAALLLGTPLGLTLLATGLVLDAVGWLWMARLTRIDR